MKLNVSTVSIQWRRMMWAGNLTLMLCHLVPLVPALFLRVCEVGEPTILFKELYLAHDRIMRQQQ